MAQPESRHTRRRQATKDSLLVATRELVAKEGTAVGVQAIADGADVSLTTLYNHFDSKEQLLRAAALHALFSFESDVNERMADVTDPTERLVVRTRLYLRMGQTHKDISRFLSRLSPDVTATQELYSAAAEADVRAAMAAGTVSVADMQVVHLIVNSSASRFNAMRLQDSKVTDTQADELAAGLLGLFNIKPATLKRLMKKPLTARS